MRELWKERHLDGVKRAPSAILKSENGAEGVGRYYRGRAKAGSDGTISQSVSAGGKLTKFSALTVFDIHP